MGIRDDITGPATASREEGRRMTDQPATIRLWGQNHPVTVTVPARLVTRKDAKGRPVSYVVLGVGPE
jgi:hypothetical protein